MPATANDLELYERHASDWWASDGRFFRSLRSVGAFHLDLVEQRWGDLLCGSRVVDLGCGGGHMAIALAQRGAQVVGVDRSAASVDAAGRAAMRRCLDCRFIRADLCDCPLADADFDLAVMGDVLEHLEDPAAALREAGRLLRPGGRLFVNTFDRTLLSRAVVVGLGEGLGLVPRGTHDGRLFVRPDELALQARAAGLVVEELVWERPALLRSALTRTVHLREARRGIGYSAFLRKEVR